MHIFIDNDSDSEINASNIDKLSDDDIVHYINIYIEKSKFKTSNELLFAMDNDRLDTLLSRLTHDYITILFNNIITIMCSSFNNNMNKYNYGSLIDKILVILKAPILLNNDAFLSLIHGMNHKIFLHIYNYIIYPDNIIIPPGIKGQFGLFARVLLNRQIMEFLIRDLSRPFIYIFNPYLNILNDEDNISYRGYMSYNYYKCISDIDFSPVYKDYYKKYVDYIVHNFKSPYKKEFLSQFY